LYKNSTGVQRKKDNKGRNRITLWSGMKRDITGDTLETDNFVFFWKTPSWVQRRVKRKRKG